jgi:hypothetical protein
MEIGTICINCVKDDALIQLITQKGHSIAECSICKSKYVKAVEQNNTFLEHLIRSLIRYNIDKWEYDSHFGGTSLETVIFENKYFFSEIFFFFARR